MDYIKLLTSTVERRKYARPLVELLTEYAQKLFTQLDFVYSDDEFIRNVEGYYELKLDWCEGVQMQDWYIERITFTMPGGSDSISIDTPERLHLPYLQPLIDKHRIGAAAISMRNLVPFSCHALKIRW